MLVEGKTSREIAALRSRSWETIRTQLRMILNKAGVEGQLDLVRLVLGYPVATSLASERPESEPWGQFVVHEISDDRFVEYISAGKKNGRQFLFLHGSEPNHMISRVLLKELLNKGARVLAPLRMGYGATSLEPQEASKLSEVTSIAALLDTSNGVEIITSGTGFRTALAFANAYPHCVTKLWAFEPVLPNHFSPIEGPNEDPNEDPNKVPWAMSLIQAPEATGFLVKVRDSNMRQLGIEDYLLRHYASSLDTKNNDIDATEMVEMIWASELISRGLEGVVRDMNNINSDWLDEIKNCETDITILQTSSSASAEANRVLVALNPKHIATQKIDDTKKLAFYSPGIAKIFQ